MNQTPKIKLFNKTIIIGRSLFLSFIIQIKRGARGARAPGLAPKEALRFANYIYR